jgi:hypothetical protein
LRSKRDLISSCSRCGAASPLTQHGRGQRERAVGRVVPALASAAVMPCRDTVAGGFPTTLGTRSQRLQTSPTRRAHIKRFPCSPTLAVALPFVSSRSHARVTGALQKRAPTAQGRAIRSPSRPRQRRRGIAVFPLALAQI